MCTHRSFLLEVDFAQGVVLNILCQPHAPDQQVVLEEGDGRAQDERHKQVDVQRVAWTVQLSAIRMVMKRYRVVMKQYRVVMMHCACKWLLLCSSMLAGCW